MRGVFIQKPLEFRLEVPLETATQGEKVPCVVTVKNHGGDVVPLTQLSLQLSLGNLKKVKAKADDAFETISNGELDRSSSVSPGAQLSFNWDFTLDRNAPISEKNHTPYLLYGNSDQSTLLGQLPLPVKMHPHYKAIFDTFETVFSFINKGESWKGGYTSVKYKAPDIRKLSLVDEMNVSVRFVDEAIEVLYAFKIKKLEATSTNLNFKKGKAEVAQSWTPQQYLFGGGFIRQEFVEASINEALSVVATGF
jgi:hypothetical protein